MGFYVFEGVVIFLVSILTSKHWATLLSSFVLLPFCILFIAGSLNMITDPVNSVEIGNKVIVNLVGYFGDHIVEIVISDLVATGLGYLAGLFVP